MKNRIVFLLPFFIVTAYCLFLLSPLFQTGFFPIHDDTQVVRVHQMTKALQDGMFPVRWVSDLGYGYGYPIFNFYAPLAYYVGSGFDLVGFDELVATKIMIGLSVCVLGIGMYLLSSRIFGKAGGIISAIIAVSSPYIALNIFVRGAVSELYGLMWIPFIFYAIVQILSTKQYRYVVIGSLSFAAMILSHNLTALMVSPFIFVLLGIFFIKSLVQKQHVVSLNIFLMILSGILISGFYWVPAIFEIDYTNVSSQVGGGADFRDHFVCITQLWESQWGYGGSTPGCVDGLSFRLGKLHIAFLILVLPLLFLAKKSLVKYSLIGGFLIFSISLFLSMSLSQNVWEIVSPMEFIQYPWRFLGLMSLSAAFLAGGVTLYPTLYISQKKYQMLVLSILVVFVFIGSVVLYSKLFRPQTILDVTSKDYTKLDGIHFDTSKISDEYLPQGFKTPKELRFIPTEPVSLLSGSVLLLPKIVTTDYLLVESVSNDTSTVHVNTAYFPSWHVSLDGENITYAKDDTGLFFDVPKGNHTIEVIFKSTPVQVFGNTLSIIGILVLFVGIISRTKRHTL